MQFEYYVNGQSLTKVDSMIALGVTLSMTFENHILKKRSRRLNVCQVLIPLCIFLMLEVYLNTVHPYGLRTRQMKLCTLKRFNSMLQN